MQDHWASFLCWWLVQVVKQRDAGQEAALKFQIAYLLRLGKAFACRLRSAQAVGRPFSLSSLRSRKPLP